MIGRLLSQAEQPRADRQIAVVRIITLPVIAAGELLVNHPEQHTALYLPVFVVASVYALLTLGWAQSGRSVPVWVTGSLDVLLLSALVYTTGGPFSQARFAFFLVPVAAALAVGPRQTAVASGAVTGAYLVISLVHPATGERAEALEFELAQGFYLALVGAASTLLAHALAARTRRIDELSASRNRLVAQALAAEDRERRRLAEALHDESIQNLLAASQELSAAPDVEPDLSFVQAGLDRTVHQLRDAVFELHPYVLEHGGLAAALRAVCQEQGRRAGFAASVDVQPGAEGVDDQLLFSVARELVTNAAKHAGATQVHVSVRRESDAIELDVIDDGRGLDRAALDSTPVGGHIGLAATAERIEAVGGRFELDSSPRRGVRARASIPVVSSAPIASDRAAAVPHG